MATFILIPGGWQGGWVYGNLADIDEARAQRRAGNAFGTGRCSCSNDQP